MSRVPHLYRSTDSGAPALSGSAGALTNVLDAILVDGYGAGTDAKVPAGWTREFTATNKRVYRNSPVAGSGTYLRVDDTAAIGNARHAFMRAYEAVSDIDTGTGPQPTTVQRTNGCLWPKSAALNSDARAWAAVACDRWFYLFIDAANVGIALAGMHFAGDINSLKPGDAHAFLLDDNTLTAYSGSTSDLHSRMFQWINAYGFLNPIGWGNAFGYLRRSYTGASGAIDAMSAAGSGSAENNLRAPGGFGVAYPSPVSGGLLYDKLPICENPLMLRGFMPGVYYPMHNQPFSDFFTLEGVGGLDPEVVLVVKRFRHGSASSGQTGQLLFDLTSEG